MNVHPAIFLAAAYIRRHAWKAFLVVLSLTTMMVLPAGVSLMVRTFEQHLVSRSSETPFVLGARGSQLDLVLHGLYFSGPPPEYISYGHSQKIRSVGTAEIYPVFNRHSAQKIPVVGVTLEYFDYRNLEIADGSSCSFLADAVLGARVARKLGLNPGDTIITDSDNVFNIAGNYPLELKITGVLKESGSPDDTVIFVDLKTAWLIEGIGHGHQEISSQTPEKFILEKDADSRSMTTNAAVLPFTRITPENRASVHFHGNMEDFPLTQILIVPQDDKSASILEGRYVDRSLPVQLVRPDVVIRDLMGVVFQIQKFFAALMVLVGFTTLLLLGLVISLSLRLRQREMHTFFVMGCSPARQFQILITEILIYFLTAASLTVITLWFLHSRSDLWLHLLIK